MKKQILILTLLLVTVFNLTAQKSSGIISFEDQLLLKANIDTQSETFSIVDNNERFTIEALNSFKLQLSANYKFLGFSVAFSPVSRNSEFRSKFLETQLQFFIKKHWIQSFNYRRVQGFYVENVSTDAIEKQFPNLKTTSYTGATSYVFNENFSLKHLTSQNEWQQYSAGSFIPILTYGFNRVSDVFEGQKFIQNNLDFTLSQAYYYTWCLQNNWFVTPHIAPEIGVRFSTDKIDDIETKETLFKRALNLGLQFGYTSDLISAGATFNFSSSNINNRSPRNLTNDQNFANLYFAYRLDPPKILEKTVSTIEEKLGL